MNQPASPRLYVKLEREMLPRASTRFPFLYLEHGRLEIDDSSVKWCDSAGRVLPLPVATLNCLVLGPGTSITHDAVRTIASSGAIVIWTGEDTLLFYACGVNPVADTRKLRHQAKISSDPIKSLECSRKLFGRRFPEVDFSGKKLKEMMGMEGHRVRALYEQKAKQYQVGWAGRSYVPGKMELSDITNRVLTAGNACLYGVITSCVTALGFSPHLGFIHSGSPLPFVYDLADLYKEEVSVDLAFSLTKEMAGVFSRELFLARIRERMLSVKLVERVCSDIFEILEVKP